MRLRLITCNTRCPSGETIPEGWQAAVRERPGLDLVTSYCRLYVKLATTRYNPMQNDPGMRCSMTGVPIRDSGDGVWDDGEWVSWAYINQFIDDEDVAPAPTDTVDSALAAEQPEAVEPQGAELLTLLMDAIAHASKSSDPFSQWGRIGELYAAERFGIELTRAHTQGHDGRLGDDFVEIKTITPGKRAHFVTVKRAGNFNHLAVVRVDSDYQLDARLVRRDRLPPGDGGRVAVVSWGTACRLGVAAIRPA